MKKLRVPLIKVPPAVKARACRDSVREARASRRRNHYARDGGGIW
jgi:hypothetical protein